METTLPTDYFAPPGRYSRFVELTKIDEFTLSIPSLSAFPGELAPAGADLERADRITYIIMGLAVLIAIVIPLLNLT